MRRTTLLASIASVAVLFAACSSNDEPSGGQPSDDAATDSGTAETQPDTDGDDAGDSSTDASDTSTDAPDTPAGWDPRFALPGMQTTAYGGVDAMVVTPKRWIYVGGNFHHAGSTPAKHVAVWNGLKWNPVGAGLPSPVVALAATAGDEVFAVVEKGTGSAIWHWNKTAWTDLGVTTDDRIRSIDVAADGTVWIAGWFTKLNDADVKRVARLKDAAWAQVGDGFEEGINVVRVVGTGACVGGNAEEGSVGVACWDGAKWDSRKGNLSHGEVKALRVDAKGALVAAGTLQNTGSPTDFSDFGSIARWDDATKRWELVGGGVAGPLGPGDVMDIATFGDKIYIGGYFVTAGALSVRHVAMWDGKKWWDLDGGVERAWGAFGSEQPRARTLAVDEGGELYVGGPMTRAGGVNVMDIAHWDGGAWTAVDDPTAARLGVNGASEAIAIASDGSAYVGGTFGWVGRDVAVSNVARLSPDGAWSPLAAGLNDTVLDLAISGADVWAVGRFSGSGMNASGAPLIAAKGIARWNGKAWSGVGGGLDGAARVVEIAPDGKVWVGGEFESAGTTEVNHLAVWDGTKWSAVGGGVDGSVAAILFHDGKVYVGGDLAQAGTTEVHNVAVWDGTTWSALGELDGPVDSLAWYGDKLVAGGGFKNAGHLASWNGTAWTALGGGVHGTFMDDGSGGTWETYATVSAIGLRGADLFAVGMFDMAGAPASKLDVRHLARWDGAKWSKVDGDLDDVGAGLFVAPDSLWIAGPFGTVGENVGSVGIGRWVFAK